MCIGKKRIISLMVAVFAIAVCARADITVDFLAGTPAGWDLQALAGDISRNNIKFS